MSGEKKTEKVRNGDKFSERENQFRLRDTYPSVSVKELKMKMKKKK